MRRMVNSIIPACLLLFVACQSTPHNGELRVGAATDDAVDTPPDLRTDEAVEIRWVDVSMCETATAHQPITLTPEEQAAAEVDIAEAVFRQMIEHRPKTWDVGDAFYLKMPDHGDDPPNELLRRFTDHKPPVRPESEMDLLSEEGKKSPHAELLRTWARIPGVALVLDSFEWHSTALVSVEGRRYYGRTGASGARYCVQNENGVWRIIEIWDAWLT